MRIVAAGGGTVDAEQLLRETRRALARTGGSRPWIWKQRRVLAAIVIMEGCTAEQAEAALDEGERHLNDRGYKIPWELDDDIAYPLQIARDGAIRLRSRARSTLRLLKGGAT